MKIKYLITSIILSTVLLTGCEKSNSQSQPVTIDDKLASVSRIKSFTKIQSNKGKYFTTAYSILFEQYIDHKDKTKGTFTQRLEFGYNGINAANVLVTEGYYDVGHHYAYATDENEIAYLLKCNYLTMEHRYFGKSLPVKIEQDNEESWKYLTTEQAAADAHDVVTEFKKILTGKWVSTGGSKSGMTTELFAYYYPGDVDLYVPYVAPFCNSRNDTRMAKFIYEEAGNQQYGETRAKELRKEVLQFQIKMLEYREVLAPRFYQAGITSKCKYSTVATQDLLYDTAVFEFAIGFWQYNQNYRSLENCLAMIETKGETAEEKKQNEFYSFFTSVITPEDLSCDNEFTPYYIQAWQELGNYGYDFSYIRNALGEDKKDLLTITDDQAQTALFDLSLTDKQIEFAKKELVYTHINNMLSTTELKFILIYGSSDPWYAVRPDDPTDNENVTIVVNTNKPHGANISNLNSTERVDLINKIKTILDLNQFCAAELFYFISL